MHLWCGIVWTIHKTVIYCLSLHPVMYTVIKTLFIGRRSIITSFWITRTVIILIFFQSFNTLKKKKVFEQSLWINISNRYIYEKHNCNHLLNHILFSAMLMILKKQHFSAIFNCYYPQSFTKIPKMSRLVKKFSVWLSCCWRTQIRTNKNQRSKHMVK